MRWDYKRRQHTWILILVQPLTNYSALEGNVTSLGFSFLICNLIYILGYAYFSECRSLITGMALDNIESHIENYPSLAVTFNSFWLFKQHQQQQKENYSLLTLINIFQDLSLFCLIFFFNFSFFDLFFLSNKEKSANLSLL